MTRLLLILIWAYRMVMAPLLGPCCRYEPSCSAYATEAIGRFGPWRGMLLGLSRVLRCHPWHAGGWDPVPGSIPGPGAP
jgi:putative membrane protein insertion efficiency factor